VTAHDPEGWGEFRRYAHALGVGLDDRQLAQFQEYLALLREWNRRFNLTALTEPRAIVFKHFLDSLTLTRVVDWERQRSLIDVGSGAGFPGVPLAIAFPHLEVLLLDSQAKRVRFCARVAAALGLERVQTLHARAEEAAHDPRWRERFDVAAARAVAELPILVEWCLPFVRVGGVFVAMKGPKVDPEVAAAQRAIERLGGGSPRIDRFPLPGTDVERALVVVPKCGSTPPAYPRRGGARKRPL